MNRFAAEIFFYVKDGAVGYHNGNLVSTVPHLEEHSHGIEKEIFNPLVYEDERVSVLPNGKYHAYITGTLLLDAAPSGDASYVFIASSEEVNFRKVGIDE